MYIAIVTMYRQAPNKRRTLIGNQIIDHSDVKRVKRDACRRCSNYVFILYLTPGLNRLGKDKCKTRREPFKFWYLVCLILEILR